MDQEGGRKPWNSINFVCAHDGFTLADLVTYNKKHNLANGEDNNDGENHNNSWNCGQVLTLTKKLYAFYLEKIKNKKTKYSMLVLGFCLGHVISNLSGMHKYMRFRAHRDRYNLSNLYTCSFALN
jgi:pullulanase/glycogen debranching enzyme